jgi:cation transport ATPase
MSDILDDFKGQWDAAKKDSAKQTVSANDLVAAAQQKMRSAIIMHVGNTAVLVVTLIGICLFFVYVAPLQETLSHIGMSLMIGGLVLRILIEFHSIHRSTKIDLSDTAFAVNKSYMSFYTYRKKIHGSVTIGILIAYTVGFYILLPEFGNYFTQTQIILLALSYLVAAAIFGYSIKIAIRKEVKLLKSLMDMQHEMTDGEGEG